MNTFEIILAWLKVNNTWLAPLSEVLAILLIL
jgi:hypothetical protein